MIAREPSHNKPKCATLNSHFMSFKKGKFKFQATKNKNALFNSTCMKSYLNKKK
jgi:hypothetical protein